jgi:hypothetical protein
MYVHGGTGNTMRITTLTKLQWRRSHVVRHSDGKARIVISNEYMYNVMQCSAAGLYSSQHTYVPFRLCLGDVRREFMQHISYAFHGTLGSYLRDALQESSADAVACLPIPRDWACGFFSLFPF